MDAVSNARMDRTAYQVVSLDEADDDRQYWRAKSPQERMAALELLRQIIYGYNPATTRLQRVLRLLNSNKVEYLVIGGYAVNFYGFSRATADLDIWVATTPENAERVAHAVREFGFMQADTRTFLEPQAMVRMGVPPLRLEILTTISGVVFEECYSRCTVAEIEGIPVKLIRLDDLKRNKQASGRLKDRLDLEQLG